MLASHVFRFKEQFFEKELIKTKKTATNTVSQALQKCPSEKDPPLLQYIMMSQTDVTVFIHII
jgi:hypothetical protein